jgi:hypothetical protein
MNPLRTANEQGLLYLRTQIIVPYFSVLNHYGLETIYAPTSFSIALWYNVKYYTLVTRKCW